MSIYKLYAPKCCLPGCINLVGYHKKSKKLDGTVGYKWKTFCNYHRETTMGRAEKEKFMKSRGGCENRNGILGLEMQ